jgi:hypothetical protein
VNGLFFFPTLHFASAHTNFSCWILALRDNQFVLLFRIIIIIVVVVGKTARFETNPSLDFSTINFTEQGRQPCVQPPTWRTMPPSDRVVPLYPRHRFPFYRLLRLAGLELPLWRPRHRCEGNIKKDFKDKVYEGVD